MEAAIGDALECVGEGPSGLDAGAELHGNIAGHFRWFDHRAGERPLPEGNPAV